MRLLTRRETIIACFSMMTVCMVALGLYVGRSSPVMVADTFGDITIRFGADQSTVPFRNSCTILSWQTDGARQVYLDGMAVEPAGYWEHCLTSAQMPVLKVDYGVALSREYRLPIGIMVYQAEFIILSSLILMLFGIGVGLMLGGKIAIAQTLIGMWFIVWSMDFIINRTSFRLFDGNRYFALFDDAMISMRYAWNFVNGHGLVWNVGERVEGYSNLLMVIAMMPANFLFNKGMAVFVMHLFGLVMMLMIAHLTVKIASRLFLTDESRHQALQKVMFFGVALSYYPLTYWSLMGMETSLLTVMMLLTFKAMLDDKPYSMALFAGLTYLTRQDGLLLVLPIMVYWAYKTGKSKRQVLLVVGLFTLFPLGQQLFRMLYYGEWLPNTYIMKVSGIPLAHRLTDGLEFVFLFIASVWVVLVGIGLGALQRPTRQKLLVVSILGLLIAYQVYIGGDAWLYWRLFSPIMPLVLSWFVHEIVMFSSIYAQGYVRILAPLIVVVMLIVGPNQRFLSEISGAVLPYDVRLAEPLLNSAVALNYLATDEAQIGVIMAGILPYYTGLYAIDYLGKSDPVIANLPPDLSGSVAWLGRRNVPGHVKYNLYDSLQQRQPDFTQECAWGYQNLCDFAQQYYRFVRYGGHGMWLRRDSPYIRWDFLDDDWINRSAFPLLDGLVKSLDYQLASGIVISGVEMTEQVRPMDRLYIGLLLSADEPQELYIVAYELVDEAGNTVFVSEITRLIDRYTTADLMDGASVGSQYEFIVPHDVMVGDYDMYVMFYHPVTLEKVQVFDGQGQFIGDRALLGGVQVVGW